MSKIRRFIRGVCSAAMCVALMGCSGGAQSVSQEALPDANEVKSTSPYPDPEKKVELDFFADCTWLGYDTLDGIIPEEVEKLTGVSFNFTKGTDPQQLALMISSGDLPDVIMTGSSSRQYDLSNSSLCWSYNDLIEKYAPDWEISEIEQKINANYSDDGKFYMLKNEFNTVDEIKKAKNIGPNFGQIHIRQDLYKEIGSPPMNDKDSFFAVMEKVKQTYPDMIPMVLNIRNTAGIAQLVGYDPGMPKDENGNYCWNFSDPRYKEFIRVINEMYRNDYIIKENFTYTDDSQMFQHIGSGKAFAVTHFSGNDEQTFTSMVSKTKPGASFTQVPLMDNWNYTLGVSGWSGIFISKDCKDPETALKLVRWAKEPKNQLTCMTGVEGEDWILDEDGNLVLQPRRVEALAQGRRESDYTELGFLLSATDYIRESLNFYSSATPATKEIFNNAVQRANWSNIVDLCYPRSDSDERILVTNLSSLESEYFAILGTASSDEEFERIFNEMITEAKNIGLDQINDYYSTTYKELSEKLDAQ